METNIFWNSKENYLAHYGVIGMRWGYRKDLGRLNSLSRKTSRMNYDINKKINKYNKLVTKHHKLRDKGKTEKAKKVESKAWKEFANVSLKTKERDKTVKSIVDTGKFIEKKYNVSLKTVNKAILAHPGANAVGLVGAILDKKVPYVKFKKDRKATKTLRKLQIKK